MKYLGIDYGRRKIGLSLSEGELASPFDVISSSGLVDALNKIVKIIEREGITDVVIGMPGGEIGKMTSKFIAGLKQRSNSLFNIIEADETLSSVDARALMIQLNTTKSKRQEEDSYSAALILQRYLDQK